LQVEILIQNVSPQCTPNLVAAKTLRPRKIIWVATPECEDELERLRVSVQPYVREQLCWRVGARDAESLHATFIKNFAAINASGCIIYHLTGGTKSMALQGLFNLGLFGRNRHADVFGMVMDPVSQYFDLIYPHPVNNWLACQSLELGEMLAVHGSVLDSRHRHDELSDCSARMELWETMRLQASALKRVWHVNDMRALHRRPPADEWRHYRASRALPKQLKSVLRILTEYGYISELSFPSMSEACYRQHQCDVLKLITGGWLECWLGAVLCQSSIVWNGARVSAKVNEPEGGSQEFDFLGASERNRLVYWSCKTDAKLTNDKLFEVDSLRDGIAGSDFHVAGLLHTAEISKVMRVKAGRMRVHSVCVHDADAAEQVVRISGGS